MRYENAGATESSEHCISGPSFRRLADHLAGLRGQGGGG